MAHFRNEAILYIIYFVIINICVILRLHVDKSYFKNNRVYDGCLIIRT